jgi:hypothetical protein
MQDADEKPGKTLNNKVRRQPKNSFRIIDIFSFVPIIPMP